MEAQLGRTVTAGTTRQTSRSDSATDDSGAQINRT